MRFWDASAIAGFCVTEPRSAALQGLLRTDPDVVVWWATRTECMSALARLIWKGILDASVQPSDTGFVCLDRRLAEAARKEGFSVLP